MKKKSNQSNPHSITAFNRLLADYRAVVYEKHFSVTNDSVATLNASTKAKILVIEDNADQWFLTQWALLKRFPQAQVQWLTNDSDVVPYLDACRQQQQALPHMILVDLYLPTVQQGLNVFQNLKSHPIYRLIPTLALSYSNSDNDIAQALDHSADGYVVKPTVHEDWLTGLSLLDRYLNW